jgi:hypothetical protein
LNPGAAGRVGGANASAIAENFPAIGLATLAKWTAVWFKVLAVLGD